MCKRGGRTKAGGQDRGIIGKKEERERKAIRSIRIREIKKECEKLTLVGEGEKEGGEMNGRKRGISRGSNMKRQRGRGERENRRA